MNKPFSKYLPYTPTLVLLFIALFYYLNYWDIGKSIAWDGLGYYLYLPSGFIYDDLTLKNYDLYDSLMKEYDLSTTFYQVCKAPNGNWMMKYTMGKAVLMYPFFLVADIVAQVYKFKQDGLSMPYQVAIFISGLLYFLIGGIVFTKFLIKVFNRKLAFILMTLFLFGTSAFAMVTMGITNIHLFLFFLYSLFLWYTLKWHETKKTKHLAFLGIVFGLMILTRPTEGIALFIPLLWGVKSKNDLKDRFALIKQYRHQFTIMALIIFLIGIPQLLYWKIIGGSWLITDYGNPAEGFDWFSPHILDALFSYKKGWFLYTPMMMLGVAGFYWLYKRKSEWFLPLLIFTALNIYVVSSWSCWWYAESFSNRGFSHASLVLIIPLGFAIQNITNSKLKYGIIGFASLFFVLNQFQTWQFSNWILDGSKMTKEYYWKIFGKTSVNPEDKKFLLADRVFKSPEESMPAPEDKTISKTFKLDFEDVENPNQNNEFSAFSGKYGGFINGEFPFTKAFKLPFHKLTNKEYAWLEIKGKIKPTGDYKKNQFSIITSFDHDGNSYGYRALDSQSQDWKTGEWNDFKIVYLTPNIRDEDDEFFFYLWNRSSDFTAVDDIEIKVIERNY